MQIILEKNSPYERRGADPSDVLYEIMIWIMERIAYLFAIFFAGLGDRDIQV